jgi:iron complex outermembrane receptor protein
LVSSSTTAATAVLDGNNVLVKANVAFQANHHTSLKYSWKDYTFLIGVQNVFDKAPPSVTTLNAGLGLYNYVGVSLENSQYNEGFYGRRGFVRVSKKF